MKKSTDSYKKYRMNRITSLIRYAVTLCVLGVLIIKAPSQAAQFAGYIGAFIVGGTKAKGILGF